MVNPPRPESKTRIVGKDGTARSYPIRHSHSVVFAEAGGSSRARASRKPEDLERFKSPCPGGPSIRRDCKNGGWAGNDREYVVGLGQRLQVASLDSWPRDHRLDRLRLVDEQLHAARRSLLPSLYSLRHRLCCAVIDGGPPDLAQPQSDARFASGYATMAAHRCPGQSVGALSRHCVCVDTRLGAFRRAPAEPELRELLRLVHRAAVHLARQGRSQDL